MAKKRKKEKTEVAAPEVVKPPTRAQPPASTRNLDRPKGSIRIVRGRKDAK